MAYMNLADDVIYTQMYIVFAILFATIFTFIILRVELYNIDMIYIMKLLLPIGCGYILFLPCISMLMDIFICTEEARGNAFFDID